MEPRDAIDLKKYPIENLQSPEARALVDKCRRTLADTGACELPGFLSANGLSAILAESRAIEHDAYHSTVRGNAYLVPEDETKPADHPLRLTEPTALAAVAYDQFPPSSLLRRLYEWEPLMFFVGRVIDLPEIHRYADPMGALNLAVMRDGDYLRWHFDQTDFVTSIALQSAEEGGAFEFVPMIRDAKSENYDEVRKLLKGDHPGVTTIPTAPGSFILFKGRYSIHRVSTIKGGRTRLMALLGYDSKPGVVSSDHLRQMRYGRTRPLHET